ncbi:uncharacterized protein LOC134189918 [Corticium candelabrum]|uniref:uncharacterized protein LOC134189918 n=1 Tax=Corticium candelabrum TaxID=121492 RepID=UPI002E25B9FD|nr:uncharacterized protein LOC134189918 [Corticium candelabrum]
MTDRALLVATRALLIATCVALHPMAYTGRPYGQLVALASDSADTVALVTVQTDGMAYIHWNKTFPDDFLTSVCQFGFDIENSIIYLPSMYEVLGLDAGSGRALVSYYTHHLVYFYSFNYDYVNKSVKGICSGNSSFNWCSMQVRGEAVGRNAYEFMLPDIEEPEMCNYDVDFGNNTMWYRVDSRVLGVDLRTGERVFQGVAPARCIAHDRKTGKVFGVVSNGTRRMSVIEIGARGNNTNVTNLPDGYHLESPGLCEVHAESRSMFLIMMKNVSVVSDDVYLWALFKLNLTSLHIDITPVERLMAPDGSDKQLKLTHFVFFDEHV